MPQEDNTTRAPYSLARKQRDTPKAEPALPPSDKKTITPEYLLNHENHFDRDTYTPDAAKRNHQGYINPDTTESHA